MNPSFSPLSFFSSPPFHVIHPFWCFVTLSPRHFLWSVVPLYAVHFPSCLGSHSTGWGTGETRSKNDHWCWNVTKLVPFFALFHYRGVKWCSLFSPFLSLFLCRSVCVSRMVEYSLDLQNINLSAIRTVRVLRPLKAINRVPSETIWSVFV